ncbi:hypothetical protein EV586_103392 [Tumebacillus sp. BK434]|nr:hypothetical protein [Tumebacillus sp. BK434]TCP55738.1 hypothetical protein EV586_103392 [Tumebacillus sp. BK434]
MALNKVPPIVPKKGTIFVSAAFLATFLFFFTRQEPAPEAQQEQA